MSEPVTPEALPSRLQLNLRILSIALYNFANYLTIGLPLAVLPSYVHDVMGFSAFWAGLVISVQYSATLLSRPYAGHYADLWGAKKVVLLGLSGCLLSGLCYVLAGLAISYAGVPIIYLSGALLVLLALGITLKIRSGLALVQES